VRTDLRAWRGRERQQSADGGGAFGHGDDLRSLSANLAVAITGGTGHYTVVITNYGTITNYVSNTAIR